MFSSNKKDNTMDSNWKGVKYTRKSIEKKGITMPDFRKDYSKNKQFANPKKETEKQFQQDEHNWRLIIRFKIGNWDFN